jgi:hypothetical protein
MPLFVRALAAWLVLLAAMMVNGSIRVLVLQPRLGEDTARQAACGTGILLVFGLTALLLPRLGGAAAPSPLTVGVCWLACTVAFEFLFGHYVAGASWASLLEDFDVSRGRLWSLVLLSVLAAPWAVSRARGLRG